ncbi:MAG TPA: CHAD domain-containing protein [Acidimicrobiia bacterium]|nr:CHAD domain-containing protein [Acidimicrobiia bacterium]
MAFALDPGRPIPAAVTKAAETQLRKTVEGLTGQTELDPDDAAHDARKRTKKVRALLRLARPELGDKVYRRENRALRDAARLLSPVRDAWVLIETLDDLVIPPDEELSPEAVAAFRALLTAEHRALQTGQEKDGAALQAALAYEQVLARVSRWPLNDHGWASLDDGVGAVFRRGRDAMARARAKGRADDFHEWRKQVKYLRHQFGLLRGVWPDVLEAMEDTADDLGERLGTDHDLAVLRERLESESVLDPAVRTALLRRIDTRRKEHQRQAFNLGLRLYAEKPSAFRQRLGRLWNAAA